MPRFLAITVFKEGNRKHIMNRFLGGLIAFVIVMAQALPASLGAQLNDLQAGRVANVVGLILEKHHFRGSRFDDVVSNGFLTNYLNSLDYNHMIFLQSDVDGFKAKYGNKLDEETKAGKVNPCFQIF